MRPQSVPLAALLAAAALLQCGRLGEAPLAGGSGAGNPGGTVAFTMTAKALTARQKAASMSAAGLAVVDTTRPVTVTDRTGLRFTLTTVALRSSDLRFELDTSEVPYRLLHAMRDRPEYLDPDSNCIVLRRPVVFDAVRSPADPAMSIIQLPVGKYTGVRLVFNRDLRAPGLGSGDSGQIVMSGTFSYGGAIRRISVNINRSFSSLFRFAGGIFTLSPSDTTHVELCFDTQRWFSNIDFTYYLSRHLLAFDAAGSLNVSSGSSLRVMQEIEQLISRDFISSGKLIVY